MSDGTRSTFEEVVAKYIAATNPVTKWVYRDIIRKRLDDSIDLIETDFATYCEKLRHL